MNLKNVRRVFLENVKELSSKLHCFSCVKLLGRVSGLFVFRAFPSVYLNANGRRLIPSTRRACLRIYLI
jgi:hypothetical protein